MTNNSYAYSLNHDESGWTWKIYDEGGEIVDSGRRRTQRAAELAATRAINTVLCGLRSSELDRQTDRTSAGLAIG
jgi:hypothetical protein